MQTPYNPFRAALPYLFTPPSVDRGGVPILHNTNYVCHAIDRAMVDHPVGSMEYNLCVMARQYIRDALGPFPTVFGWLQVNSPEYRAYVNAMNRDSLNNPSLNQAYRWDWLQHMASQYATGYIKLTVPQRIHQPL